MEAGRTPSLLGKEMFRAKVTNVVVRSFEDVVIFVHDVVAVQRVAALPIAEAEEQLHLLVVVQWRDVLARHLDLRRRRAVAAQDLELFHVDVDRVHPAARVVLQHPVFHAVLLHAQAHGAAVGVHQAAVDHPLPVAALEVEGARDARRGRLIIDGSCFSTDSISLIPALWSIATWSWWRRSATGRAARR